MKNPYCGYGCPVSGKDFIGRRKIVEDVSTGIKGGNVFLTGLHRMGKSSVAKEVGERLSAEGMHVCRVVNMSTVKRERDLFRLMLFSLESPAAKTLSSDDDFLAFIETEEAFEAKRRERASPCVMIVDEMDGLLSFDDPAGTLNRLRDLAYYPDRYGVNFLFVSSRSLKTIEERANGSNLSGICRNVFLKSFGRAEAADFIAKSGIHDDGAFVDEVYAQTGGVPHLMAVLMSEFCDRTAERGIGVPGEDRMSVLADSVSAVSLPFLEYYEKVKHTLSDDDNAWGELIGALIGPIVKTRDPVLANLFREYGIIDDDGSCPSRHFTDYLEMRSREIAPFEDLRSVEVSLRRIVKERLAGEFGAHWADEVGRELPGVAGGLTRAKEALNKDIRQFHLASETDLIEFTDLGDIKEIVTSRKYWPLFQSSIGMGLTDFRKHMDQIIRMRNRTMHHRPGHLLPPEQVAMARESCKALLARIG